MIPNKWLYVKDLLSYPLRACHTLYCAYVGDWLAERRLRRWGEGYARCEARTPLLEGRVLPQATPYHPACGIRGPYPSSMKVGVENPHNLLEIRVQVAQVDSDIVGMVEIWLN